MGGNPWLHLFEDIFSLTRDRDILVDNFFFCKSRVMIALQVLENTHGCHERDQLLELIQN